MAVLAVCAVLRVPRCIEHERTGKPTKEWLLIEWPEGEKEPTKYWLSTLPGSIAFRDLVDAGQAAPGASSAIISELQAAEVRARATIDQDGWLAWLSSSRHDVLRQPTDSWSR